MKSGWAGESGLAPSPEFAIERAMKGDATALDEIRRRRRKVGGGVSRVKPQLGLCPQAFMSKASPSIQEPTASRGGWPSPWTARQARSQRRRLTAPAMASRMTSAKAKAISGGTAFPICRKHGFIVPSKRKPSGKLCRRAASRTEIVRACAPS